MRINIKNGNNRATQKMILRPEALLRYLLTDNDKLDTLIMCKGSEIELTTSDFALHEALGSIKAYDNFRLNKLVKLFEAVKVISHENLTGRKKSVLTEKRVDELRKLALKKPED